MLAAAVAASAAMAGTAAFDLGAIFHVLISSGAVTGLAAPAGTTELSH